MTLYTIIHGRSPRNYRALETMLATSKQILTDLYHIFQAHLFNSPRSLKNILVIDLLIHEIWDWGISIFWSDRKETIQICNKIMFYMLISFGDKWASILFPNIAGQMMVVDVHNIDLLSSSHWWKPRGGPVWPSRMLCRPTQPRIGSRWTSLYPLEFWLII